MDPTRPTDDTRGGDERVAPGAVPPGAVPDSRPGAIRRLLLATDLTSVSRHADERAIALAKEHGAELIVLSVVDANRLRLPGGRFLRRIDQERAQVEAKAQALVQRARAAGVHATFLVWEGDPAETILSASESEGADVIVLGSHERGRLGRLVLGSISTRVSDEAHCQVLIVPPEPASATSGEPPPVRLHRPT
jgi:nucleotide-binding universal stress UspA family protein